MSPDEVSRQYHNLRYAIKTLSSLIESKKKKKKDVDKGYEVNLAKLIESLQAVEKMLEEERNNQHRQREKWYKKIRSLSIDAILDETISEEMQERIVEKLSELAEGVRTHEDA